MHAVSLCSVSGTAARNEIFLSDTDEIKEKNRTDDKMCLSGGRLQGVALQTDVITEVDHCKVWRPLPARVPQSSRPTTN